MVVKEVSQHSNVTKGFGGMWTWVEVGEGCGRQRWSLEGTASSVKMRDVCHLLLSTYCLQPDTGSAQ